MQPADLLRRTWRCLLISDMAEQFWLAPIGAALQSCWGCKYLTHLFSCSPTEAIHKWEGCPACVSVCGKGVGFVFQLPVLHTHPTLPESASFYLLQCLHFAGHILQPATCTQTLYCHDTRILLLSAASYHGAKRLEHNKELWLHINATLSWPEKYKA